MPVDLDLAAMAAQRAAALTGGDPDALRRLLHPAFRWTSHRGETVDREAYVRNNIGGGLVWKQQTLQNVTATVVEGVGVVTAVAVDEIERDGVAMTFRMPVTQTWVRVDGRWMCLAGHAGPVLESTA